MIASFDLTVKSGINSKESNLMCVAVQRSGSPGANSRAILSENSVPSMSLLLLIIVEGSRHYNHHL